MKVDLIANYLYKEMEAPYCNTCRGRGIEGDFLSGEREENYCDNCHRKYMGYGIGYSSAYQIAEDILKIINKDNCDSL